MPQYELLTDVWKRASKDKDGNRVLTTYHKGDTVEMTKDEAEHYLLGTARVPSLKPVEKKSAKDDEDSDSDSNPETTSGGTSSPASARRVSSAGGSGSSK